MNRIQLIIFSVAFWVLAVLFMALSTQWKGYCNNLLDTTAVLISCIRGHTFAAYPYIFGVLGTAFGIAANFRTHHVHHK